MPRGFASLTPERRRELAAKGGRSVPAEKRAFSTNRDLARDAGAKGGASGQASNRAFSRNPALASAASKKARRNKGKDDA